MDEEEVREPVGDAGDGRAGEEDHRGGEHDEVVGEDLQQPAPEEGGDALAGLGGPGEDEAREDEEEGDSEVAGLAEGGGEPVRDAGVGEGVDGRVRRDRGVGQGRVEEEDGERGEEPQAGQ